MHILEAQGAEMPALGLGTWRLEGDTAERVVRDALAIGYRHIDTAGVYANEAAVGRAIRTSGITRNEIFLTTKIWPDHFAQDELPAAVNASLTNLGLDYVDLLLLHWPNPAVPLEDTIGALTIMREAGKTRHIGVSNFTVGLLHDAHSLSSSPLLTNQVEYHPFLDQSALQAELLDRGMILTAYSPLAKGRVMGNDILRKIGAGHDKSAAQVVLRWLVQQENVAAIPKATSREHLEANIDIWDFALSDEEMEQIFSLTEQANRLVNPARLAPDWGWPKETEAEEEPRR